jgi:hypothetical protein
VLVRGYVSPPGSALDGPACHRRAIRDRHDVGNVAGDEFAKRPGDGLIAVPRGVLIVGGDADRRRIGITR